MSVELIPPTEADRAAVAFELLGIAQERLPAEDATMALLIAAVAILDPSSGTTGDQVARMLLHAVREALEAWHDPVGIVPAGEIAPSGPAGVRRDRVKPGRSDWQRRDAGAARGPRHRQTHSYLPLGPDRPQRYDRDRPAASEASALAWPDATLRARLLSVIGNAIGPDRQCHLTVAAIAARARAAPERTRKELSAMVREGRISRFRHANGETATMILPAGAAPAVAAGEDGHA